MKIKILIIAFLGLGFISGCNSLNNTDTSTKTTEKAISRYIPHVPFAISYHNQSFVFETSCLKPAFL